MTYIRTFQPFPCQNNEFIDILFTKDVVVPYNETLYAIDTLFISVKLKKCLPLQAIYFLKNIYEQIFSIMHYCTNYFSYCLSKRKFTGWSSLQSQSEVTDKSQLTKETQPYLQSINNSSDGTTEFTS